MPHLLPLIIPLILIQRRVLLSFPGCTGIWSGWTGEELVLVVHPFPLTAATQHVIKEAKYEAAMFPAC